MNEDQATRSPRQWWNLLLIIPFIAVLWVPFFGTTDPQLAGFPFFYWYQLVWVVISAIITAIVYFLTR